MRFVLLLILLAVDCRAATPDQLAFRYQSADGEFELSCKHYVHDAGAHDFRVICGAGTIHERSYLAHVLIRGYVRQEKPRSALEILYWVTDRQAPDSQRFSSTSQWLEFSESADVHRIRMSQSVENDYAALIMDYFANGKRR